MRIQDSWSERVEKYTEELYTEELYAPQTWGTPAKTWAEARLSSDQLQKTGISLGLTEARLVSFLIRQQRCRKFVEIGTLTGASALWILQALPEDGKLWTLEKDPAHAAAARKVLAFDARAEVVEGDARETLLSLERNAPFDGIFIDGNKAAYGDYLNWAERSLRAGALVIADNVFLGGAVFSKDSSTDGSTGRSTARSTDAVENGSEPKSRFSVKQVDVMRKFNQRLADPRVFESCLVPTQEGLLVAIKK